MAKFNYNSLEITAFREWHVSADYSSVVDIQDKKIFRSLAFGNWPWLPNLPSVLLLCALHRLQPPMLWSTRQVPVAPLVWEEGKDVVLRLQPGKGVSGVCFFCCPIASTWVAQDWVFIMLPRQVVRSYGEEGWASGPRTITIETQCRQHQSAVPQEVSEITPWGVPGVDGKPIPSCSSVSSPLELSLSAGQMLLFSNLRILN